MANRRTIYTNLPGSRGLYKRVVVTPGTGTGHTSVPDGSEDYFYEVTFTFPAYA